MGNDPDRFVRELNKVGDTKQLEEAWLLIVGSTLEAEPHEEERIEMVGLKTDEVPEEEPQFGRASSSSPSSDEGHEGPQVPTMHQEAIYATSSDSEDSDPNAFKATFTSTMKKNAANNKEQTNQTML